MLDEKELIQVREYVIKILPELLRSEPEIATTIEGILAQHFPRRDEFARLLDEVRDFRQETNQRFDELHEFRLETNQRFEQVDQRFGQVDQRFEQVDQRFEQVDQRFEQVDQRLGKLETTQLDMRRDIAQLKSGQDTILKELRGMNAWFRLIQGETRRDKGAQLEDGVAAGLRYGLKNPQIKAKDLRLRQKFVDTEGFEFEVDLIVRNGEWTVFEVKATGKLREVSEFARKVHWLAGQHPDKKVRGILIALGADEETKALAQRYGLELVD